MPAAIRQSRFHTVMNHDRVQAVRGPVPAQTWGIWILVGALLLKIALLLTSQSGADGDEAVVGVMAKHMLEGKEFPLVFYGQHYGGGATVEAALAANFQPWMKRGSRLASFADLARFSPPQVLTVRAILARCARISP
jgi:hypothetical protein